VLNKARDKTDTQIFLADLITDENLFNIDDIPDPHEPHCYVLTKPGLISSLNFPFSLIFNGKIDSLRDRYLAKSKEPDFVQDLHDLELILGDGPAFYQRETVIQLRETRLRSRPFGIVN